MAWSSSKGVVGNQCQPLDLSGRAKPCPTGPSSALSRESQQGKWEGVVFSHQKERVLNLPTSSTSFVGDASDIKGMWVGGAENQFFLFGSLMECVGRHRHSSPIIYKFARCVSRKP